MTAAITFEDVHQSYRGPDQAVLRGVDLTIAEGDFCIILGRSGMGKSTLLRCINGLVQPYQGTVTVAGQQVSRHKPTLRGIRRRTGVIFQGYNLVNRLTALQNVLCGMLPDLPGYRALLGAFTAAEIERGLALLRDVGLEDRADQRVDQLSGGQKQRVGIARVLAQEPTIILADEPVASLDPVTSEDILSLLSSISREKGITVVVSLHQIEYARSYGERIIALLDGRLAIDTRGSELSPEHIDRIYGLSPERARG